MYVCSVWYPVGAAPLTGGSESFVVEAICVVGEVICVAGEAIRRLQYVKSCECIPVDASTLSRQNMFFCMHLC